MKQNIPELFGSMVFDDRVMRSRLSADVYESLRKTIEENAKLDTKVADVVAAEMRDWAVEKGATHFTHWFQPLTGVTAEKHDSFISVSPDGGGSWSSPEKELIKGEPDASSFLFGRAESYLSKPEATQPGIPHPMPSSSRTAPL